MIDRNSLPRRRQRDGKAFTQADLLARGWSKAAIGRILGEPDEVIRRRGGGIITYYLAARVETAERERQGWRKSEKRAAAAQAAAARAAAELRAAIDALTIKLPEIPQEKIRERAIRHYNARGGYIFDSRTGREFYNENWTPARPDSDPDFLARITTNYVRHELVSYDDLCEQLRGKIGRQDAYAALREKVDCAAVAKYPDVCGLTDEEGDEA